MVNYSSVYIRSNVEKQFAIACGNELDQFGKICESMNKINDLLRRKSNKPGSLEHIIGIINSRICDHMISATLLIGKGFIIDGISLVRSSYEDLWLVQNIFFRENYLEDWKNGQEVRPWRLRQLKEIEEIKEENEIIYKALCNISHCSLASVEHMMSINQSIDVLIHDYRLLLISYYSFAIQIIEAMEEYYGESEEIKLIYDELISLEIVMFESEE